MTPRLRHLLPPALAAFALAAPAAHASFPGINGEIAFPAGAGSIRDRSPVDLFTTAGPDTLHRLAGGAGAQGGPAWSADGRRLAYASDGVLVIVSGRNRRRIAVGREVA